MADSIRHRQLKDIAINYLNSLGYNFIDEEWSAGGYFFDIFGAGIMVDGSGEEKTITCVVECGNVYGEKLMWAYTHFDNVLWIDFSNNLISIVPSNMIKLKNMHELKKTVDDVFK